MTDGKPKKPVGAVSLFGGIDPSYILKKSQVSKKPEPPSADDSPASVLKSPEEPIPKNVTPLPKNMLDESPSNPLVCKNV